MVKEGEEKAPGILALHIGGSKFSAGIVSPSGTILLRDRVPAPSREPWNVIAGLIKRICAAANEIHILGCGLSVSGPIDRQSGTVSSLNYPTWKNFALAQSVSELVGVRTIVDNEAKALAAGEAWNGSARGMDNFLAVYVGSSVSAGIMVDGQLLHGDSGNAGFIGHMVVDHPGRECRCGGKGCLEAYVSARAIEKETGHLPVYAPPALIERSAQYVGQALSSSLALIDVPTILLGGSVVAAWSTTFVQAVEAEVRSRSRLDFTRDVNIMAASLGSYGVLIGAASLIRREMDSRP